MRPNLRRRTIALVTAYAVALQALLPVLLLVVGAGDDRLRASGEVCITAVKPDRELPREQHNGCTHGLACLATGCSALAATLPSSAFPQIGSGLSRLAVLALHPIERAGLQVGLPHSARAPPHA